MILPAMIQYLKLTVLAAVILLSGFCVSPLSVVADTIIDDFTDATNDRFSNDSSFIVPSAFSLSGVGRTTTGGGRWATLIGDNAFLTAAHRAPTVGSTIEFYSGNDPNASPFSANVVSGGTRVVTSNGTTDLFVGYLDRVVDPSIGRYDFARTNITAAAGTGNSVQISPSNPFQNQVGLIVGISPTSRGATLQAIDQAAGFNRITGYAENVSFQGNTDNDTLIYEYNDADDLSYLNNEAYIQGGDSGAPNFIVSNGELLLLGVNSFQLNGDPIAIIDPITGEQTGTEQFQSSGISYTGNVADEIDRLISLSPSIVSVPEPSSTILFSVFSLLILRRNRK